MNKKLRLEKMSIYAIVLVLLIGVIFNVLFYNKLPDNLPIHWDISGNPDGFANKFDAYIKIPGIVFLISIVGLLFIDNDPKNINKKGKMLTFGRMVFPIIILLFYINMTFYGLGKQGLFSNIQSYGLGLVFIILGNYLPKAKRNYTVGIKLPWTMESDENWNKTHRLGGICFIIAGILLILTGITGNLITSYLIPVVFIIPVTYSFYLHTKGI